MNNIPIYRAKRINSDKYLEGHLFKIWDKYYILWGTTNNNPNKKEIDPSTIAISFDKCKTWRSLNEVQKALEYMNRLHLAMPADYEEENTKDNK